MLANLLKAMRNQFGNGYPQSRNNDYFKFLKNKILVGSLKFKTLYIVNLNNKRPYSEIKFLKNKIGRIRDVLVHPKGHILLINDERDGGLFKLDKH